MAAEFEGRSVLITGAAGGFGRVLTRAFAERGAHVLAADVAADGLSALADDLKAAGIDDRVTTRTVDISDHEACPTMSPASGRSPPPAILAVTSSS